MLKYKLFYFWIIISLSLLAIPLSIHAYSTSSESWTEDALLHDGRIIKVNRKVDFMLRSEHFFLTVRFKSYPDTFSLMFEHPDTHETINWKGKKDFNPVMLDIVDGVPYLVIHGRPDTNTEWKYGCPELPYIFLKYEKGFLWGSWKPISVERFPSILQYANLSPEWDYLPLDADMAIECNVIKGRSCRDLTHNEILGAIKRNAASSGNYFQAKIPRSYEDWNYSSKNRYKSERRDNDCRPPRSSEYEVVLPPPQEVSLEILETNNYNPERFVDREEWHRLMSNNNRNGFSDYCKSLFKLADPNDPWMGWRFTKDVSGKKKAPYKGNPLTGHEDFDKLANMICEQEYVLYYAKREIGRGMVLTKYSVTGNMLYRINFQGPEEIEGYHSGVSIPSMKSDNGYLNFEWWDYREGMVENTNIGSKERGFFVKRILKVKFCEQNSNQ